MLSCPLRQSSFFDSDTEMEYGLRPGIKATPKSNFFLSFVMEKAQKLHFVSVVDAATTNRVETLETRVGGFFSAQVLTYKGKFTLSIS